MTVVAGVDVGNATTEVVLANGRRVLAAGQQPTRGRKGSQDSLRGAAALVRRLERRSGCQVDEVRVAPLRAVDTATVAVPARPPQTGRLRVIAAGAATPGGTGACVGSLLWLGQPARSREAGPGPVIAVVPPGLGYAEAVRLLGQVRAAGIRVGAILADSDEGVLIANRISGRLPVADQADTAALAGCELAAVEVRPPGQPLALLTDPIALGAALQVGEADAAAVSALCRSLLDYSNAVVAVAGHGAAQTGPGAAEEPWLLLREPGLVFERGLGEPGLPQPGRERPGPGEPATSAGAVTGRQAALRAAYAQLADWPVGAVSALTVAGKTTEVDDLFAVDLAAVAESATARRGRVGRALLVASLAGLDRAADPARQLHDLLGLPAWMVLSEPAAARLGAATTPGAAADALVIDVGAGTIDVITPDGEVVAAGAGELLTAAVAETLGISRAAADWVKRGPCLRVEGGQRFEAEDGSRGFLDRPAPAAATGMLAVAGPAGLLPFGRRHSPAEWRALRLRLKQAVLAANLGRAVRTLGVIPRQVLVTGGPASDDELVGILSRSLPDRIAVGRANAGATLAGAAGGPSLGYRYAAALGLALAEL